VAELLADLRRRGMRAPVVMVADGALGLWAALRDVFPAEALCASSTCRPSTVAPEDQRPDRVDLLVGPGQDRVTKGLGPRLRAGDGVQAAGVAA
jgi:hypothetical protein